VGNQGKEFSGTLVRRHIAAVGPQEALAFQEFDLSFRRPPGELAHQGCFADAAWTHDQDIPRLLAVEGTLQGVEMFFESDRRRDPRFAGVVGQVLRREQAGGQAVRGVTRRFGLARAEFFLHVGQHLAEIETEGASSQRTGQEWRRLAEERHKQVVRVNLVAPGELGLPSRVLEEADHCCAHSVAIEFDRSFPSSL